MNKIKVEEKSKSLKRKLMAMFTAVCMLLLIITGVIIYITVNRQFTVDQENLLQEASNSTSKEAELFFQKNITIAQQMAQDKNIQNFLTSVEERDDVFTYEGAQTVRNTLIATQQANEDVVLSAYIGEAEPSYYYDDLSGISDIEFDLSTRPYYKTFTDGIVFITEPYVDVATGSMVITITAPVYVGEEIVGFTGIDITIDSLSKVVGDASVGESGYFTLLTKDNTIVYHKESDNILKAINEIALSQNLVDKVIEGDASVIDYSCNEEKFVGNVTKIGDTGWKIVSSLPLKEFKENIKGVMGLLVLIYLIALIVLAIAIYLILNTVTNPIIKLTAITNKLAGGELDVNIDVDSDDEIGILAKSIEKLTARLKSYIIYIEESVDVLGEMAEGNLKVELKNDYDGEFAKLKEALLNMAAMLKDTLGRIKGSANSINMDADQVSTGAQALAQGATEQASAIEELSAEINEIYTTIVNNEENAENAGNKSMETSKEVERGNLQMKEMLSAMGEISNSSSEIGKIIKVIDDIAFQTNILALNAAVEAARAGAAGKGFAVVADEVRNLAGKSAEAAQQTTALIENSIKAINKGTSLAGEAGKSLAGIVSKTSESNDLINQIVKASSQQTVSVNQIKGGIEQISAVIQENAATAETSAANSEELSGQAHLLNELVDKFHL